MINMELLEVVTPLSIHHGCLTGKTFWEENFTVEENFTFGEFIAVKMKNCGLQKVRKNRDINSSDK